MQTINIFIASSAELKRERRVCVDLFLDMNQEPENKARGVKYEPVLWEYMDSSMNARRKEDEYLDELRKSDVCIALFWKTRGEYTVEELDVAVEEMQAGRKPRHVYVFYKEPSEDQTDELRDFKNHFAENYPGIPQYSYSTIKELLTKIAEIISAQNYNTVLRIP